MALRGGGEDEAPKGKGLKRVMSHQDIETETFGEQDTLEARYFAKDKEEDEHRSLYGPSCIARSRSTVHSALCGSGVPVWHAELSTWEHPRASLVVRTSHCKHRAHAGCVCCVRCVIPSPAQACRPDTHTNVFACAERAMPVAHCVIHALSHFVQPALVPALTRITRALLPPSTAAVSLIV